MPAYRLELPTIQNWSCQSCGGCCKQHGIYITEAERERIEQQGWTEEHGIPREQPIFVKMGGWFRKRWHRLAHQPDGACVFLDEKGLCRIHARFGEAAKPLACRIYPYAFHPAGPNVTVALRFSCPTVVANGGRAITDQRADLKELARLVVPENVTQARPPRISPASRVDWNDFHRFVACLESILEDRRTRFLPRLLKALAVVDVIEQARFDKLSGPRLEEFLSLVRDGVVEDVPQDPFEIQEPTRLGRTQFRLLAGQYARKDTYASRDNTVRGRLRLLRSALSLTGGRGLLPVLQPGLQPVPFESLERPFGVPEAGDDLFERYMRVKLQGLSFCGVAYYRAPLVEGFRSLALVYPSVLWIARWLAAGRGRDTLEHTDVAEALAIADHHHGYSPAFGAWGFRKRVQTMAKLGDIPRLCAWYSR